MELSKLRELTDPTFADYLFESFINPLKNIGFDFTYYQATHFESMGTHTLIFETSPNIQLTPDQREELTRICTQDDDSHPAATFRLYFGTLFLYIPYIA